MLNAFAQNASCQDCRECHVLHSGRSRDKVPFPPVSSSTFSIIFLFFPLAFALFSFKPCHLTPSSLLLLFCLPWVMPDNDLSCKCLCVCAFVHVYVHLHPHPTPTTTPIPLYPPPHLLCRSPTPCLLPAFSLCQFLSFETLLQREKLRRRLPLSSSYVITQITVALRYHVSSQQAQRLRLT